ncbi:MAG: UbiA family prenyltransferase [Bacteroidia bacterium]
MHQLKSTLLLMRIPFSFLLMPVFWFALSQINDRDALKAYIIFIVLHLFIYPASNGYNSYMDKDIGSIGGIKNPPKPTKQLLYASILFDTLGIALALQIHLLFAIGITIYVLVSRAYSWDGIRIKKYGWPAFFTVSIFQGGYIYLLTYVFAQPVYSPNSFFDVKAIMPAVISSVNIAGIYPITQIYQHKDDEKAGVKSLSRILGIKGTFLFSGILFLASSLLTFYYFNTINQNHLSYLYCVFMLPVGLYFTWWYSKTKNDIRQASFRNTMIMSGISATFFNLYYMIIILMRQF